MWDSSKLPCMLFVNITATLLGYFGKEEGKIARYRPAWPNVEMQLKVIEDCRRINRNTSGKKQDKSIIPGGNRTNHPSRIWLDRYMYL